VISETEDLLSQVKLRYTSDDIPGFSRKMVGDTFQYFDREGKRITEDRTIARINKLAIPPAYTKVWISPFANGHMQATGMDKRGRKQYRYHPLWIEISQQEKFSHVIEFAEMLPIIRKKIRADLRQRGMPKEKVLAAVVWLLENTLIRVGNEEYERENKSYGLTTLKNRHASVVQGSKITFQFKGKSGVYHFVRIQSKRVARIIRKCKEIPGQDLFRYIDDNKQIQTITSDQVNDYLQSITGSEITAKDFRTWGGTLLAASVFDGFGISKDPDEVKKNIVETVKKVALHLRNKPNTCKKYYIHPSIIDAYTNGQVISNLTRTLKSKRFKKVKGLDDSENRVLQMLRVMVKEAPLNN
jgi:DNA topoisomerase-1